jgi:two-component sensor histidine kinase
MITLATYTEHHATIASALDEQRAQLRDDLAAMTGSEAEHYTDEDVAEVEDRVAALDAAHADLTAK